MSCQILFHYRLQWATMVLQDLRLVKQFSESDLHLVRLGTVEFTHVRKWMMVDHGLVIID
jgi:hypothetical protein